MATDHAAIFCYVCNMRANTIIEVHQHMMFQHSIEDITTALTFSQFLYKIPQMLDDPYFEGFLCKYPHFRVHQDFHYNNSLLHSPDIFATCSPLLGHYVGSNNFHPSSYPSTPVLDRQLCNTYEMSSFVDCSLSSSGPLDLRSPEKIALIDLLQKPRSRISSTASADHMAGLSQHTNDTDIDVVSFSQNSNSGDASADGGRKFKCSECPKSYKLKAHLTRHQKSTHSNSRPHQCEFCPKAFKLKELLNQHILTHGVRNPFKCEVCRSKFKSASELSKHKSTKHNDLVHNCPHCNMKFSSPSLTYVHLASKHGCELKCFKCGSNEKKRTDGPNTNGIQKLCEKEASNSKKEEQLMCEICHIEFFGDTSSLTKHMQSVHDNTEDRSVRDLFNDL